jgi:predicted DNA binding CopG/RHH family protein
MKGRPKGTPASNKGKSHRPPSTTISVRLPVSLLEEGKEKALGFGITWNRFAVQAILEALADGREVSKG